MTFNFKEFVKTLDNINSSKDDREIFIWGAYEKSNEVLECFYKLGRIVVGYIDRKAQQLNEYNNLPVYLYDILKGKKAFIFVALTRYDKEIEIILNGYGYREWEDYWYPYKEIHIDGTSDYQDKYGNYVVTQNKTPIDIIVRNGGAVKIEDENLNPTLCIRSYDQAIVEVGKGSKFEDSCKIIALTGNIKVGARCKFQYKCGLRTTCEGQIHVGNMCTFGRNSFCVSSLGAKIIMEEDCMISYEVNLRAGNSHNIIDLDTLENLDNNPCRDIKIGKHVWIGMKACLINGVEIGAGSVVGANSFLAKKNFRNNVLIAGNPSRILRNHVAWIRDSDAIYTDYSDYIDAIYD